MAVREAIEPNIGSIGVGRRKRNPELLANEKARERLVADTLALLAQRPPIKWLFAGLRAPTLRQKPLPHGFFHHTSTNYEFCAAVNGKFLVATSNDNFEIEPGSLLLIPPGVTHCELAIEEGNTYQGLWCHIEHSLCEIGQITYIPPSKYQLTPRIELIGQTDIESVASAIATEIAGQNSGWAESAYGLWVYLTNILRRRLEHGNVIRVRSSQSRTIPAEAASWDIIGSVLEYCAANFRKPIGLKDVARAVGYSPSHISRLMRLHLGIPVSAHLLELKLVEARELLLHSHLSITHIAHALGYTDPSHFSRAFTRTLGFSPKTYRKQVSGLRNRGSDWSFGSCLFNARVNRMGHLTSYSSGQSDQGRTANDSDEDAAYKNKNHD